MEAEEGEDKNRMSEFSETDYHIILTEVRWKGALLQQLIWSVEVQTTFSDTDKLDEVAETVKVVQKTADAVQSRVCTVVLMQTLTNIG